MGFLYELLDVRPPRISGRQKADCGYPPSNSARSLNCRKRHFGFTQKIALQKIAITKEKQLQKRDFYERGIIIDNQRPPRDKIPKKRELLYAAPLFVWCDEKTYAYARVNGGVRLLYEKEI